jgi:hypothetical protein
MSARRQSEPGGELATGSEDCGVGHRRSDGTGRYRADPRNGRQTLAGFAGVVPRHDALLGLCDRDADGPHVIDQAVQHLANRFRQAILLIVQSRDRRNHTAGDRATH